MTYPQEVAVRQVRMRTGAGFLDALRALEDHAWSVDAAVDFVRRRMR